jgi:subtilisin family serine protease
MSNLTDLNKKNINDIIKKVIKLKIPVLLVPVDCDYNDYNDYNDNDKYDDHYPMRPKTQAKLKKKSKSKKLKHYYHSSDSDDDCYYDDDCCYDDWDHHHHWDHHYHWDHHDHWRGGNPKSKSKSKNNSKPKAQFPAFERYIIVFKDSPVDNIRDKINTLKIKNGFKLKHTLLHTIKGCTATIDKSVADELSQDPDIEYIEKDNIFSDMIRSKESFNMDAITPLWNQTITNTVPSTTDNFSNINCYVLDTGIMANHSEFYPNQVFMSYNAINRTINAQDDNGHGTCVASLIGGKTVGAASRITMHSIKVLDSSGSGYVSDIISGLNWIMQNKKTNCIINMSLGGMYSKTLDTTLSKFVAANIPVICSAGNSGADASTFSPASTVGVYAISAHDQNKSKPTWANYGPSISTFAPGDMVKAAWNDSTNSYYLVSGTSFACPIVAGIITRFINANPKATLLQINEFLNRSSIINEIINTGSINTPNKRLVFNQAMLTV